MRREVPVRFGEGLGVTFPRPTRLIVQAMRWREFVQRFGLVMKSLDDPESDRWYKHAQ